MMIKLNRLLFLFFSCWMQQAAAQQHLLFSRFLFSPTIYNPSNGIDGHYGVLSAGHRSQWMGISGAPQSQFLSYDQQFSKHTAAGGTLTHDQIGPYRITNVFANYAYQVRFSPKSYVSLGLSASLANWKSDWSKLDLKDEDDPVFQENIKRWVPNFGAGLRFVWHQWSAVISVPRFFESQLSPDDAGVSQSKSLRHFYMQVQRDIPVKGVMLTPRLLYRNGNWLAGSGTLSYDAPRALDLGCSVMLPNKWSGGLYWRTTLDRNRSSDYALGISAGYRLKNGTVMVNYDAGLNQLQSVSGGSVEIFFGYIIHSKKKKATEPQPPVIEAPVPVNVDNIPPSVIPKPLLPSTEPESVFSIKGIVFDMTTGLPAEGARVTIIGDCAAPMVGTVITGADGLYFLQLPSNCCYRVTAEKDGFKAGILEKICTDNPNNPSLRADLDLTK